MGYISWNLGGLGDYLSCLVVGLSFMFMLRYDKHAKIVEEFFRGCKRIAMHGGPL